jgi:hypothetical protein
MPSWTRATQELLRLFPEIRPEGGKIDCERLKLVLGDIVGPPAGFFADQRG